jgi:predicted RNA methylase
MAARAEAKANADIAMAETMRKIADGIESGNVEFLDQVRTKTQVEMLDSFVHVAKSDEAREKFSGDYQKQEEHSRQAPTPETVEYADYPRYTAWRSDLASLGRQLQEIPGTKRLGDKLLRLSDDVTDQYKQWVKDNLFKVSTFKKEDGSTAGFKTKKAAAESILRSGYRGQAIPFQVKRGEHVVVMSPSEAQRRGIWPGQEDTKVTLSQDLGEEIVTKLNRTSLDIPWVLESAHEKRKRLSAMNIETPAEFRSMLQEYVSLQVQQKAPDRVKELERSMVGRRNDGLDFFPTPADQADEMIEAANIEEGMSVLEPSAGMGHIADQLRAHDFEPDVIEISPERRELLEAKGYNLVDRDFMEHEGKYDRIVMNPPFSDRRDFQHVQHAYSLLNPGGRLVAIMGEGVFFGSDKRAQEFRDWFESVGGMDERLAEGTFEDTSLPVNTSVNARMIVIDKSADAAKFHSNTVSTKYGIGAEKVRQAISDIVLGWQSGPRGS